MPKFTCALKQCRVTLRFGDPAVCPSHGHPLQPHVVEGLSVNWSTGCKSQNAEEMYKKASFSMEGYMPATQRGLFNVSLFGGGRQIIITVKVFPRFTMPVKRDWGKLNEAYAKLTPWTESDQFIWMGEQQKAVDDIWNRNVFRLRLAVPDWGGRHHDYKPEFRIVFVQRKSDAHIVADIEKAPPTNPQMFNCGGSRLNLAQINTGNPKAISTAAMNSESGRPVKMNSAMLGHKIEDVTVLYNIIAHEYGHMIGLPDEYNSGGEISGKSLKADAYAIHCNATNKLAAKAGTEWVWNEYTESLMSTGNQLRLRHLITVWEAATVATANYTKTQDWHIV